MAGDVIAKVSEAPRQSAAEEGLQSVTFSNATVLFALRANSSVRSGLFVVPMPPSCFL